jgi:hypothetical protein
MCMRGRRPQRPGRSDRHSIKTRLLGALTHNTWFRTEARPHVIFVANAVC